MTLRLNTTAPSASAVVPSSGSALIAAAQSTPTTIANAAAHAAAQQQTRDLAAALTALQPYWAPLPLGPYPPASDTTSFPRTGTPGLIVSSASVTKDQLAEPARAAKGLADQAVARRPKLSPLFWIGLGCLGVGIYLSRQ